MLIKLFEETPLYHGTDRDFKNFRGTTFLTSNPAAAEAWAQDAAVDASFRSKNSRKWQKYVNRLYKDNAASAEAQQRALIAAARRNAEGQNIRQVYSGLRNPMVVDAAGEEIGRKEAEAYVRQAKSAGHDGVIIRNAIDDNGNEGDIHAVFNSKNIRNAIGRPSP